MAAIQARAARTCDMGVKTEGFWSMENISAAFRRHARPGESLNDPRMPIEIRPIAHCGMGIGAFELADFNPEKLVDLIDSFSNPEYRLFAYENVGSMVGIYEPDVFTTFAKFFASLGILPIVQLHWRQPEKFLAAFDPEIRRLISHGYGRMLYFKNHTIAGAIHTARRASYFQFGACVQGVAFAYSMVNHSDLGRVFQAGERIHDDEVGCHFLKGLIYALEFWEWMSPGTLESMKHSTSFAGSLIESARKGIQAGRSNGALAPFFVIS